MKKTSYKTFQSKILSTSVFYLLLQITTHQVCAKNLYASGNFIILNTNYFFQSANNISGTITALENGKPVSVIGATVTEKGTKNMVLSDINGEFKINVKENAILVISSLGFKSQEIVVGANSYVKVTLESDINSLNEVIVTGYQNVNKKLFTGSATSLKGSDVKREGVTDVSRMLEGRVAGVSVQNVSGTFGAAPKIRVRGATSISGDNKPLWVVDGIVLEDVVNISNEQLSTGDAATLIGSSVAGLNPDDIESFNILKDAAATAQYGARAMNGVVVVTTKKGRNTNGKAVISYLTNLTSYLKPSYNNFDILNSADQMNVNIELQNKGWLNQGSTANSANGGVFTKMYNTMYQYDPVTNSYALRNDIPSQKAYLQRYANANTDWFDILFKNSLQMEHSLSVTSGSDKSNLYASTSFLQDNGWTVGDNVKRFTGNLRGFFKISDKLSFELLTSGAVRDQKAPGTSNRASNPVFGRFDRNFDINPFSYVLNTSRNITAYDADGNKEFFTRDFAPFNILDELENNYINLSQIDYKGQFGLKYKVIKNLMYSFDGSYRFVKTNQEHIVTETSNQANAYRAGIKEQNSIIIRANGYLYSDPDNPNDLPVSVLPYGGFYNTVDNNTTNYYFRNALEWGTNPSEEVHIINLFATQELRYIDRQRRTTEGYGYQYDQGGVPFIDPRVIKQNVESNNDYFSMLYGRERYLNYSLRSAYSYRGKYTINATGRYDGSNLLGEARSARWLPTWNVSGAWNVDTEEFMKSGRIAKVISRASVRATYGLTASLGMASNSNAVYRSQTTRRPTLSERETVLFIDGLENSQLGFEKQYETNVGIDLGFFNNRFTFTMDVFRRNGFDLIGFIRTSGIGGQEIKPANYADLRTNGLEVSLGATVIKNKNFTWNSQFNFANITSKITNLKNQPLIFNLIGADGGAQLGYPQRGLFSIDFKGLNPATGVPQFVNEKGEVGTNVYLQSDDVSHLIYNGSIDPPISGGFYNSFAHKSFSLSALVTFSAGNVVRLNPLYQSGAQSVGVGYNDLNSMSKDMLNRWIMPGDENFTNIPSILDAREGGSLDGYPYNNYNFSSVRFADGGFARLKTVSLSYATGKKFNQYLGLARASFSLVANNVLLLYSDSALNGQDPEFFASGGVALPVPRQFTLSLKVGF